MPSYTQTLADFASSVRYTDIPAAAIEHAKTCLLDTIGCGLFGSTLPWGRIVAETVTALEGGGGHCTLWGMSARSSPSGAALANGTMVHGFELDDLHKLSIVHPGSVVVSAALAEAESIGGVSGERFLTAMVVGYEVAARVGSSMGSAHLLQGWHPTGTHGTLGAAAACGSLMGLSGGTMLHALGIAGTQAGGLMAAQFSSMVKRFHAGRAAQSGVYAAELARRGFTGITELFESEYGGYCSTLSPKFQRDKLIEGLGRTWEIQTVGFKPYSTNGSCHTAIDTLLELRSKHGFAATDVRRIRCFTSSATKEHVGWPYQPNSVTTAQMNLPYIAAVVVTDGAAFVDQFSEARIRDPKLVELASRVEVVADAAIDAKGDSHRHEVRVELELAGGQVLTGGRVSATGSSAHPLSPAQVVDKFRRLASKVLSDGRVRELEGLVAGVETLPDVGRLARAMVP